MRSGDQRLASDDTAPHPVQSGGSASGTSKGARERRQGKRVGKQQLNLRVCRHGGGENADRRKRQESPQATQGRETSETPSEADGATPTQAPKPPASMLQATSPPTQQRPLCGVPTSIDPQGERFAWMAATSVRSLTAALGGTALSTVAVITLAGLVAASTFGILFCGDEPPFLRETVAQLDKEHSERIEQIKAENPYDKVALTGTKTAWKEALAVYAVKTTTDADNPLDVVTLDAARQQLVRNVFWGMNAISSRVEAKEVTDIVLEEDDGGNLVEIEKTTTERILYIELSHATADEAASVYGFDTGQTDMLHQLLDAKNDPLWQSVLYGVGQGGGGIVEVAASQAGNVSGQPYWSWYGFGGRVEWCACFVSWCANECGYIEDGSVLKFAYCPTGVQWFRDAGR